MNNAQATAPAVSREEIDSMFLYQPLTTEHSPKFNLIAEAGRRLARVILENAPASPYQTAAIRQVLEAVAMANRAVTFDR